MYMLQVKGPVTCGAKPKLARIFHLLAPSNFSLSRQRQTSSMSHPK
jgi:hypothetical protein